MNERTIRQWYDVFKDNNKLTEIRILDSRKTFSGYFTDIETLLQAIKPYNNYNIYFTLNAINPSCYDREQKDKIIQKPKSTTSDNEIIAIDWIMVDIDVEKPSDTNSTDEEKELAKPIVNAIFKYLRDEGFSEPIICDSGNGFHLNYRVAMLNNEENTLIRKNFLNALSMMFSTDKVKVDCSTYNASRICKTYGVISRKGSSNSKDRPQRESSIVRVPKEIKVTSNALIKKVADIIPKPEKPDKYNNYSTERFDIDAFISKHNIDIRNISNFSGGRKYVLNFCPFNESHKAPDSALFVMDSGAIGFKCLHNSDSDKGWREFRSYYEPDAYDRKYNSFRFTPKYNRDAPKEFVAQTKDEDKGNIWIKLGDVEKPKLNPSDFIPTGITELDRKGLGLMRKHITVLSGLRSCVDCDTEFFNGYEWKKISEYVQGEKVLQYNVDGSAELVYPLDYIKDKADKLWLMKTQNNGVNQCVSDDHRIIYKSSKGNLCEKNMIDLITMHNNSMHGFCGKFYTTFKYAGSGIDLSDDEIRLMCAVICDGSFSGKYKDKSICRLNLKKDRKKIRLESLLNRMGLDYRKEQYNPKDLGYSNYLFSAPRTEKAFGAFWYQCNAKQLGIICDEITYWDGSMKHKPHQYFSTNKKNADFIQFAYSAIGIRSSISIDNRIGHLQKSSNGKTYIRKSICYTVFKNDGHRSNTSIFNSTKKNEIKQYNTKDGYKYCFTVPSGMLVLRREDCINITGNCGKTSLLNMITLNAIKHKYKVGMWSGEMDAGEIKQWMYLQAAGKQYVSKRGNSEFYETNHIVDTKISNWLDPYFSLYSNEYSQDANQLASSIEKRFDEEKFDLICLDNLMCLGDESLNGTLNEKDKQKVLIITRLAKKLNVHIILVAHPNKANGLLRLANISGTGDITNLAQNVFLWHRSKYNEFEHIREFERDYEELFGAGSFIKMREYSNILEVAKFRAKGTIMGSTYGMFYEKESGRFLNAPTEHIVYGWQDNPVQQEMKYPDLLGNPTTAFESPKSSFDDDYLNIETLEEDKEFPF